MSSIGIVTSIGIEIEIVQMRSTEGVAAKEGNRIGDQSMTAWTVKESEDSVWVDHPWGKGMRARSKGRERERRGSCR